MTEYGKSKWAARSRKRKAVRDEVREAFWKEAGTIGHSSYSEIEYAPKKQRVSVVRLLQVTRDGSDDDEQKAFLPVIARAIASTGLGKGMMGTMPNNIEDLSQFHTRILEHFFTHAYKFEGPRELDD